MDRAKISDSESAAPGVRGLCGFSPGILNSILVLLLVVANGWFYFGAPILARREAAWLWTAMPAVLATPALWALLHESFHGGLFRSPRLDHWAGRLLAILFGAPFRALRFGHLVHHALNGRPGDRWDTYDPARKHRATAVLSYYVRLLFGLYLAEVAASLLALMPRSLVERVVRRAFYEGEPEIGGLGNRAVRHLLSPAAVFELRLDGALVLVVLTGSAFAYGSAWPILAALLGLRAFLVSLFDNTFHYGAAMGQARQGYNARVPLGLSALVLHTNFHGVHHGAPDLAWHELPGRFAAQGGSYDRTLLSCLLRQFAGPIPR